METLNKWAPPRQVTFKCPPPPRFFSSHVPPSFILVSNRMIHPGLTVYWVLSNANWPIITRHSLWLSFEPRLTCPTFYVGSVCKTRSLLTLVRHELSLLLNSHTRMICQNEYWTNIFQVYFQFVKNFFLKFARKTFPKFSGKPRIFPIIFRTSTKNLAIKADNNFDDFFKYNFFSLLWSFLL